MVGGGHIQFPLFQDRTKHLASLLSGRVRGHLLTKRARIGFIPVDQPSRSAKRRRLTGKQEPLYLDRGGDPEPFNA